MQDNFFKHLSVYFLSVNVTIYSYFLVKYIRPLLTRIFNYMEDTQQQL